MSPESPSFKIALTGNPNCGKTALFNALTGGRQKVGNYPGVTVERKEGSVKTISGLTLQFLDLPGTYSLDARTPDEMIARDVVLGRLKSEPQPKLLVAVSDVTNLERNLGLVLELKTLKVPVVLALNMMDLAKKRGLDLDLEILSRELGVPVVPTVAVRGEGILQLLRKVEEALNTSGAELVIAAPVWQKASREEIRARFSEVDRILRMSIRRPASPTVWTKRIDQMVLHPIAGSLFLIFVLGVLFQTIFNWATVPQDWIRSGIEMLGQKLSLVLPESILRSLLVEGVIAGVGSVLVFLPQILFLFLFILVLEDSGYMARAAFLMDRLMGKVGLHGRAFIPLLSSFACAIPGIMATRTIENKRDRLTTILIAPLMTCSARLPVYALLIAAFIPNTAVFGPLRLQGLVMFALYASGVFFALLAALFFKNTLFRGARPIFLMELPTYKWPSLRSVGLGLYERVKVFLRRAGTVILVLSVVIWFLASFPKPPLAATEPAIHYSFAGKIGHAIEPFLSPIGFNWRIGIALIPGFAAREVMVGALATVYAVENQDESSTQILSQLLAKDWSLATAISLLVWYIFALQCLSTLAVTRRETNSWKWPALMLFYMTTLAYGASWVAYHLTLSLS